MSPQLTLDGGEEDRRESGSTAPFSAAQQQILRLLADGPIRSIDAGAIVHLHRTPPCRRCETARAEGRVGCGYASSDGTDAMNRLRERGLIQRADSKGWERAGRQASLSDSIHD